ncbi:Hypothetical protein HEAR1114 [Herminiimonas arsenicoxydans]|uniref:Uncharacterized protein n=1 Tax=Herminiimonas arsenicoxydans TaxID=204773 RepID=A4G456_HERAR|nr:Hypothetical protein HEAR1114 [Herminiimonas arsenicoxydans]
MQRLPVQLPNIEIAGMLSILISSGARSQYGVGNCVAGISAAMHTHERRGEIPESMQQGRPATQCRRLHG